MAQATCFVLARMSAERHTVQSWLTLGAGLLLLLVAGAAVVLLVVGNSFAVVTWAMVTGSDSPVLQAVSASAVAQRTMLAERRDFTS